MQSRFKALDELWNFPYLKYRLFSEKKIIEQFIRSRKTTRKWSFSIVTPTYGIKATYVERFLRSLERQTNQNFEICICNDGDHSSDLVKILTKYQTRFGADRFHLINHKTNQGICAGTRSALSLASADYIAFVDADDELHPRCFEAQSAFIGDSDDYDFIYTNHDLMTDWDLRYRPVSKPIWSPETLLNYNYVNHLAVVKRSLLPKLGDIFSQKYEGCQDWDFCLKVIENAERVGHIPLYLYHWRMRPGSVAHSSSSKPYVIEAQARARGDFLSRQDPPLQILANNILKFMDPSRAKDIYTLYVPPEFELQTIIDMAYAAPEKYLLLKLDKHPEIEGDTETLMAYASFKGVACTFPFSTPGRRAAYTIRDGLLEPVLGNRSSFSFSTGNILAGPTHGCTIEKAKLMRLVNFARKGLSLQKIKAHELGPFLSLMGLQIGLRSVAVKNLTSEFDLRPIDIPGSLNPKIDPYI